MEGPWQSEYFIANNTNYSFNLTKCLFSASVMAMVSLNRARVEQRKPKEGDANTFVY